MYFYLGIFLSDIAALATDGRTLGFKLNKHRHQYVRNLVSIIGCERTIDLMVLSDDNLQMLLRWLPLLCLNSLPYEDYFIRQKHWKSYYSSDRRLHRHYSRLQKNRAESLFQLISGQGIPIEEESFSLAPPQSGFYTYSSILKFDSATGNLVITGSSNSNRLISIHDIVEVRAGKLSAVLDQASDAIIMTIVTADQVLCLPLPTIALRNQLIGYFQVC